MARLGAHACLWAPEWTRESAAPMARAAAEAGLEVIEIPLLRPEELDVAHTLAVGREYGIGFTCSLGLPAGASLPAHPEAAERFLSTALEVTARLGSWCLTGVTYGTIGGTSGSPPTEAEYDVLAGVLGRVARRAAELGLCFGLEPVNRYETHLLNTAEQTARLIERIGEPNLFIHLDSYHMNIEEKGFREPIRRFARHIRYVHLSESDRGVPGTGNVHWDDLFAALAAIGFDGDLVLESFVHLHPDIASALSVWRPVASGSEEVAEKGLAFLRDQARRAGIGLGAS